MPPQQQPAQNRYLTFLGWKKMNTRVARQNLADDECAWAENLQPIGNNDWQSVFGPAPALTSALASNVRRIWPATIGTTDYLIVWTANGNLYAVNTSSGVISAVFSLNSLVDPDVTVWASQRILIVDPNFGYCTWDGSVAVAFGGLSPNISVTAGGSGYTSPPAVNFTGGSGSGATATASIAAGQVVGVTLTNPGSGYGPNDTVTVNFSGGGGTGATASAHVWPQGIFGNAIDTFAGRVWIGNGRVLTFTGTGASYGGVGYDDFLSADASGATTILDADLTHSITAIRNLNNYLYIFGDTSIRQIGAISIASGPVTVFTPLTLSSDIGTIYKMTVKSYNRLVLFANVAGVYGIFGASVKRISDDLDGIFQLIDFGLPLSAGLIDVHSSANDGGSIHCYALLVRYMDPLGPDRTLLLMYQDSQWWLARQGDALQAVASIFLAASEHFELYGSSGPDLTSLIQVQGTAPRALFRTSLSSNKNPITSKRIIRAGAMITCATNQTFQFTVETENTRDHHTLSAATALNFINSAGAQINFTNGTGAPIQFVNGGYTFPYTDAGGEGKVIGASIAQPFTAPFSINGMAFEYVDGSIWGTIP